MHIEFKKGKIYFEEYGQGDTLVLLHGYAESMKIWSDFHKTLAQHHHVVLIDLPGHGKSDMIDKVHSMELMADCVKAVIDHLKINCIAIAGHSMGGYVSLAFARKYGKFIKGLGLFHSTSLADTDEVKEKREQTVDILKKDHKDFLHGFIPSLFAPETKDLFQEEIQHLIREASAISSESLIAAQLGMKDRTSTLDVLINASFPVMFIAGQKDSRLPFENIWVQMALTETAHALILRNVGHMGFIEAKIQTLDYLDSFAKACFKI